VVTEIATAAHITNDEIVEINCEALEIENFIREMPI